MKRFPFPTILSFLIGAVALAFAGCAGGPKLGGVTVNAVTLKSAQAALLETQVVVTLRYVNENVIPIGISGSRYRLYLNGKYVGRSVSNEPIGLPQLSTGTQDVTFMLDNLAVANEVRAWARNPQVGYRLESVLIVMAGDEKLQVKTAGQGVLDLALSSRTDSP